MMSFFFIFAVEPFFFFCGTVFPALGGHPPFVLITPSPVKGAGVFVSSFQPFFLAAFFFPEFIEVSFLP